MARDERTVTGFRWFVQDAISTAKEAIRLYFEPLRQFRDWFRSRSATHRSDRSSIVVVVDDFDTLIESNRRLRQSINELLAERDTIAKHLGVRFTVRLESIQREQAVIDEAMCKLSRKARATHRRVRKLPPN